MNPVEDSDARLVALVREAGFSSHEYRYLRDALRESGLGALARMGSARIFAELARHRLPVPTPAPPDFVDELPTLRWLAVSAALDRFIDRQVMQGGWDPHGGTSLRSYFIRATLYSFAEQYGKYYREVTSSDALIDEFSEYDDLVPGLLVEPTESLITDRDLIGRILPGLSEQEQKVVFLTAEGYTQAEIGEQTGMTTGAVSSVLRRVRRRKADITRPAFPASPRRSGSTATAPKATLVSASSSSTEEEVVLDSLQRGHDVYVEAVATILDLGAGLAHVKHARDRHDYVNALASRLNLDAGLAAALDRRGQRPAPDPEVHAVDGTEIERLVSVDMSPQDKLMFIRTAQGFSQKEIADELGISERAVSSRMQRNRSASHLSGEGNDINGGTC